MKFSFVFILSFSLAVAQNYDCDYCQPEQTHIAFGEKTNDIVITWSTFNDTTSSDDTPGSVVEYGEIGFDKQAVGNSTKFVDGGRLRRTQWIHRVTLKDLKYNTQYIYHVGSVFGWSDVFFFKVPPKGEDWVVRAAIYGDMGEKNAHSMSYLQDEAARDKFDVIIHVGDFAYDMDTNNALVGDQFMRQIEPLASRVPYMVCPGNHEEKYNFSNYKNRFSMPGGQESMFYSWDLGPVHFVSISTEFYYYINYGLKMCVNQYYWLIDDLKRANRKENREKRPWIIIYGHRPMYCASDDIECKTKHVPVRTGIPLLGFGLEPLLKDFGVDLVIWAHEHSYERTWPLYDGKVYNGSTEFPYVNPGAPVHIVTGSAGCQENTDHFVPHPPKWSAFRSSHYGYTRFAAHNNTHIYMEQVDVQDIEKHGEKKQGKVIDSFWIVKEKHEAYHNLD